MDAIQLKYAQTRNHSCKEANENEQINTNMLWWLGFIVKSDLYPVFLVSVLNDNPMI